MWSFLSWCSYASRHLTSQMPLVLNLLHRPSACFLSLCSFLSNHISCQIACCYKPATLSSFLLERRCWNAPVRDALFHFLIAGNYNSCRFRLNQGQELGGTRSKQYQLCLFTSLQTLGEHVAPQCSWVAWEEPCITLIDHPFHLAVALAGEWPYFLSQHSIFNQ